MILLIVFLLSTASLNAIATLLEVFSNIFFADRQTDTQTHRRTDTQTHRHKSITLLLLRMYTRGHDMFITSGEIH